MSRLPAVFLCGWLDDLREAAALLNAMTLDDLAARTALPYRLDVGPPKKPASAPPPEPPLEPAYARAEPPEEPPEPERPPPASSMRSRIRRGRTIVRSRWLTRV